MPPPTRVTKPPKRAEDDFVLDLDEGAVDFDGTLRDWHSATDDDTIFKLWLRRQLDKHTR